MALIPFINIRFLISLLIMFRTCGCFKAFGIEFTSNQDSTEDPITDVCSMSLSSEAVVPSVRCICDASLSKTDCGNLGIKRLPSLVSFPSTVLVANFRLNQITDINDDTFYNANQVVELDLSNNRIDFLSVRSFEAFPQLRRLIMSHNALWNLQPDVFDPLSRLEHLDLSFNDIESNVEPRVFKNLQALKDMKLNSNPLHVIESKLLEHLSKLELLDLSETMLLQIPQFFFASTPNLTILSLSSNLLNEVPTTALKVLKKLTVLNLSSNKFEVIESGSFEGLRKLSILYLDNMPHLKSIEASAFGDLSSLTELHCSYNYRLARVDEDAFVNKVHGQKVSLDELFLRQNNLQTLPEKLQPWSKFMELHLRSDIWSCDCRSKWMLHIELKNPFQDHVQCAQPENLKGKSMSEIKNVELVCGLVTANKTIVIVCALAAVVLLLLIAIAILLHHRSVRHDSKTIYLRMFHKQSRSELECDDDGSVF